MATLTTSWAQQAKWQWNPGTGFKITFYLDAKYSTQSIANNTTTVQTRLTSVVNSGSGSGSNYKFTCTYCSTVSGSGTWTFASETITSGSSTVTHNSDGTKSITLKATVKVANAGLSEHTLSATATLPTIPRKASITSAPNFTDEDNPTITYSNPAGNSASTLQASIYLPDGLTGLALYRDIPKTGTSYTFNLTNEERERLQNNCTTAKSRAVRFYVRTVLGGTNYTHYLEKTLTIVNANPTMTYTKTENNTDVISLLDSSSASTVIKNASNITIAVTPTAHKGATISSVVINHNGVNYTATESSGVYSATFDITGDTTTITTTDSRGYTVSEVWQPTVIEYQKVKQNSFSFARVNPTSSNITFTLDSVYYQQTFGNTANVPTIKWKLDEGNWNTLSSSQYTIDTTNNKVTVNITLNNAISYMNSGTFYVEVSDLLSTWTNSMNVTKGIPVFEFGEDDVQVNGDLYIADTDRTNKINVKEELEKIDTNIITVGLTANTNVTVSATWTHYTLGLNDLTASLGSKLTFNTTTHRIIVGDGVSYVKVNAFGLFRGINGSIEFNVRKSGTTIGSSSVQTSNTSAFWNGAITDMLVPVSSGDYFDISIRSSATGTVTVAGGNSMKITVEVVK